VALAALIVLPATARAQNVVTCDFDIDDNVGTLLSENTLHLTARAGGSSTRGQFRIINSNTPAQDVDHDGYATACTFTKLYVAQVLNLVNVSNDALAIPATNILIANFPKILPSGEQGRVDVVVDVPAGTPAGRYIGNITVRDSIQLVRRTPTQESLNLDLVNVEVEVLPDRGVSVLNPDQPIPLDSILIAARAGQRATGVFRVADLGNATLSDVRFSATELRSESAVNVVIPARNIEITPPSLSSLLLGDTARISVTVNVPRGILGGRYRGLLLVQANEAASVQIPLIVTVSSGRGIVFENNPVRNQNGVANIAFNGDPGTSYRLAIMDLAGLMVYEVSGTVFPGLSATVPAPPAGTVLPGADFAVSVNWPLINGRGEGVASGMYVVVVESTVNGQRQLARDKLMVIR
jgi:hypothetical protein